jgi:arginase
MKSGFAMIGVPVDSAGGSGGTELAPTALRSLGLGEAIQGRDEGDLQVRIRAGRRDPITGVVALDDVCSTTASVRKVVAETLAKEERPFLLGVCCSIVPGALAGVRDARSAASRIHLAGHLDLYDATTSPSGEAADMPITVALGMGPAAWVQAAGGPSVSGGDVWILGYRDRKESELDGMLMPEDVDPPIACLTTDEMRSVGSGEVGRRTAGALAERAGNIWVHLDLDIVDPSLFFANDAPVPNGLDWSELTELLSATCSSPAFVGISLGCYNPEKDHNQENGAQIVDVFRRALAVPV